MLVEVSLRLNPLKHRSLLTVCHFLSIMMLKKCKGLMLPFWGLALASALDYMAGLAALQVRIKPGSVKHLHA